MSIYKFVHVVLDGYIQVVFDYYISLSMSKSNVFMSSILVVFDDYSFSVHHTMSSIEVDVQIGTGGTLTEEVEGQGGGRKERQVYRNLMR